MRYRTMSGQSYCYEFFYYGLFKTGLYCIVLYVNDQAQNVLTHGFSDNTPFTIVYAYINLFMNVMNTQLLLNSNVRCILFGRHYEIVLNNQLHFYRRPF